MDDDTICPLHGTVLVEGSVPVVYGFFGNSPEYGAAWKQSFRYARSYEPGGCSIAQARPSTAVVRYCPTCRDREQQWLAERGQEQPF